MIKKFLFASVSAAAFAAVSAPAVAQDDDQNDNNVEDIIIVHGIRQSVEQALEIKRNSVQNVESIVAEDIGKFPDNNVIEALQRVTGVQVTNRGGGEASGVTIRGLADVTTTWNGRYVFTGSGRQLSLQDIPANLVKQVDVYKTRAASQFEHGIAGQIDVATRRPFDFKGATFSAVARGIYQEERETFDPNVSALISNRWDTDWGEFGALVNFSYAKTRYRDQSITAGAAVPFATADNPPAGYGPLERFFSGWSPGLETGLPYAAGSTLDWGGVEVPYLLSRDALFASDLRGDRTRPAANVALQWAPNDWSTYTAEFFWQGYREKLFNNLHFSFADWWGTLGSDPASTITIYPDTNIIKTRVVGAPYGFNSGDFTDSKTDTFVYALNAEWQLGDQLNVVADLSYQDSDYETDFVAQRIERVYDSIMLDFNAGGGLPAWTFSDADALTDPSAWTAAQLYMNTGSNGGHAATVTVDADYDLDPNGGSIFKKLQAGIRYDKRSASEKQPTPINDLFLGQPFSNQDEGYYWINNNFFSGRAAVPSSWVVPNGYYIRDHLDETLGLYNAEFPTPYKAFEVEETNFAAYAQLDMEANIAGRPLFVQGGVRYVKLDTDLEFWDLNDPNFLVDRDLVETTASAKNEEWLPSVTVRYEPFEDFIIRFNYGQTLRRPNFVDLNPNFSLTDDLTMVGYGTGSGGNPNLDATKAKNLDLAFEWYFAPESALYVTLFKRDIQGLVVTLRNRITLDTPLDADEFIVNQPVNASDGTLKGVEVGGAYFPDFLPGALDGFGVLGSLTILDSEQNIPIADDAGNIIGEDTSSFFGVSDLSYNATLAYDNHGFNARLSWVWRKDFLSANEARSFANPLGIWRAPEKSLDLHLDYSISENATVTFDATNLTKEMFQSYYKFAEFGGPDYFNFGSTIFSRTFSMGVRLSF